MSLHWYACISTNTYCFEIHYILLETDWWALHNASLIMLIHSAVHEILADKAFTATNGLISQSFVVALVSPTYVWIALIWGFSVQLSLWKSDHWLWRYKLNEVCDNNRWSQKPLQAYEVHTNTITNTIIQTTTTLSIPQIQRRTKPHILERSGDGILEKEI